MRLLHHQRLPYPGQVSIERLFDSIRSHLPEDWEVVEATSPLPSKGFVPRLLNVRHAGGQLADVHHIVGDAHYLAFGLPRRSTVLTIHDCAALNRLRGIKREILRYFWFTGPMRRVAAVTAISQTVKDELKEWVGDLADEIVVIPNCVRAEYVPDSRMFRTESPCCLQVGTGWNKNVRKVAEALQSTGCRLDIIGELDVSQREFLNSLDLDYKELGRVSDEVVLEAYRNCDFVVFASLYEGFGLPILEAQAIGRPVITSLRSSMPEAAGEGALFVDPDSVSSIRSAVMRLLNEPDLREDLVRRGFENVKNYTPSAIAGRYAELYKRVMKTSDD